MSGGLRFRLVALLGLGALLTLGAGPAGAARKTPPGDPPGNNGTIKIASDAEPEPHNEPHIDGCYFWVEYFGFDAGEQAKLTFTAQPPTGTGEFLMTYTGEVSDDAAGGGQDDDHVLGFNLSDELMPFEPHPQQGYHVKLKSDSLKAPGGSKQKVFWLKCATEPAGTLRLTKLTQGPGAPEGPFTVFLQCSHTPTDQEVSLMPEQPRDIAVPVGSTCVVNEPDQGAGEVNIQESPANGPPDDGMVVVGGGEPTSVTITNVYGSPPREEQAAPAEQGSTQEPGSQPSSEQPSSEQPSAPQSPAPEPGRQQSEPANPPAEVAGAGVVATPLAAPATTSPVAAGTLPRTGGEPAPLVTLATWVMAVGGLAVLAGRRRR